MAEMSETPQSPTPPQDVADGLVEVLARHSGITITSNLMAITAICACGAELGSESVEAPRWVPDVHRTHLATAIRAEALPGVVAPIRALVDALEATWGMDYDPSQEAWICGPHGVAGCRAPECDLLDWPKPNTYPTSDFALWADQQFREVVGPYDRGEVQEMPEDSFHAYHLGDWPIADALRAALDAVDGGGA